VAALVRACLTGDMITERFNYLQAPVSRAIVNQYDLDGFIGLRQGGLDSLGHPTFGVMARDNDADHVNYLHGRFRRLLTRRADDSFVEHLQTGPDTRNIVMLGDEAAACGT